MGWTRWMSKGFDRPRVRGPNPRSWAIDGRAIGWRSMTVSLDGPQSGKRAAHYMMESQLNIY